MQKRPASAPDQETARILSVSPLFDDHRTLEKLSRCRQWRIIRALTLGQASYFIKHQSFSMVVCERDLAPGSWKNVLADIGSLASPPFLIVTSSQADEYLWSEALNLGAYDVLAKPFVNEEVIRTFTMASLHSQYQIDLSRVRVRSAAG